MVFFNACCQHFLLLHLQLQHCFTICSCQTWRVNWSRYSQAKVIDSHPHLKQVDLEVSMPATSAGRASAVISTATHLNYCVCLVPTRIQSMTSHRCDVARRRWCENRSSHNGSSNTTWRQLHDVAVVVLMLTMSARSSPDTEGNK